MSFLLILFIIIGIILLIFFIFLGIYYYKHPVNNDIEESPNIWSKPVPIDGPRGQCLLYQFGATQIAGFTIPAGTSLNTNTLNGMTGIAESETCVDPDQIFAQLSSRTCQGTTGDISFCYDNNGNLKAPGFTDEIYTTCGVATPCFGALAVIALNFNPPGLNTCLNKNLQAVTCDITQENQLFRITRNYFTVLDGTVEIPAPSNNQGGYLAQILDRDTNLCLGATGGTLTIGDCSLNQGYNWLLLPSFITAGGTGYTGPSGPTGITGGTSVSQQIAYVTTEDLVDFPSDLTSVAQLETWIVNNNIQSLALDGNNVVLAPFLFGDTNNTQYITYSIYNTLSNIPICSSTNPVTPCASF